MFIPFKENSVLRRGRRRASSIAIGICLLLAALVLCLALGEALLRSFPGLLPEETYRRMKLGYQTFGVAHPYIGHLHTPNEVGVIEGKNFRATHHTDKYGFRNSWPWPEAAEIVAVGDSLVFGYGVEDEQAWPAVLARGLFQSRVLNLGLIGAGPEQYLRVYETFGMRLQPKVLLVGVFMANDPWDSKMFHSWLEDGAPGSYILWLAHDRYRFTARDPIEGMRNLGRRYSYLYNLAQDGYKIARWGSAETLRLADGSTLQLSAGYLGAAAAMTEPQRDEFRLVLDALTRLHAKATAAGTHVLVVFHPSKEEVYLPLLREPAADLGSNLREELRKSAIEFLNLTPVFRERAAMGKTLFFEVDGHPNVSGYALIANAVLSHLEQNAAKYGLEIPR